MDRQFLNNVEMLLSRIEARLENLEKMFEKRYGGVAK